MSSGKPLPWSDVRSLGRVLLHGTPATRRAVAERLLEADDAAWWKLLATTTRCDDDWRLRARCLEVLGLVAGAAESETFDALEAALFNNTP